MPAIAPIEDLRNAHKNLWPMVLAVFPSQLATYGHWKMAWNRLEKHLQTLAGRKHS